MIVNRMSVLMMVALAISFSVSSAFGVALIDLGADEIPNDVSADGVVVSGNGGAGGFIWTSANGKNTVGNVVKGVEHNAGTVWLGGNVGANPDANRWDGNVAGVGAWTALPLMSGRDWQATGIGVASDQSDVWIGGYANEDDPNTGPYKSAGRYKESVNSTAQYSLPGGGHDNSYFYGTSNVGNFSGQYQHGGSAPSGGSRQAMVSNGTNLPPLIGASHTSNEGSSYAISSDGDVKVGFSSSPLAFGGGKCQATYWPDTNTATAIPFVAGSSQEWARAYEVNGDGTMIAGRDYNFGTAASIWWIWTSTGGTQAVSSYLTGLDVDLTGWDAASMRIEGFADDGSVLVGKGDKPGGSVHGWVLPDALFKSCNVPFADADGDTDVDQIDFAALQLCYTGSGGTASSGCECFNRNGGVDNDVDEEDFAQFEQCATGPNVPYDDQNPPAFCTPGDGTLP